MVFALAAGVGDGEGEGLAAAVGAVATVGDGAGLGTAVGAGEGAGAGWLQAAISGIASNDSTSNPNINRLITIPLFNLLPPISSAKFSANIP